MNDHRFERVSILFQIYMNDNQTLTYKVFLTQSTSIRVLVY